MANELYVITGTSRGIGEALALALLAKGHTVLGVARSRPETLDSERYHHLAIDLSDTAGIGRIVDRMDQILSGQGFEVICLVNNASATEPLGPIEKCPAPEIERHLQIGLVAPMILTSLFVDRLAAADARKKVAFISSGLAFKAMADQSAYCTAKAGLEMFARSIGLEQEDEANGVEVISIGPGMVDTAMQLTVRSKSSDEFAMAGFFQQAYEAGKLQDPAVVARKIARVLANRYPQGSYIDASSVA